jgi:hypothetical protein
MELGKCWILVLCIGLGGGCRGRASRALPVGVQALPHEAFRVEWGTTSLPPVLKAGATSEVAVSFKNTSSVVWTDLRSTAAEPADAGKGAIRLAYCWWSSDAPIAVVDYAERTDLPRPLRPGESVTLPVQVRAPETPGDYELQFDLCQENVAWFEQEHAKRLILPVRVQ